MIDHSYYSRKEFEKKRAKEQQEKRTIIEQEVLQDHKENWRYEYYKRCFVELQDRIPYDYYKRIQRENSRNEKLELIKLNRKKEEERFNSKEQTILKLEQKIDLLEKDKKDIPLKIISILFITIVPYYSYVNSYSELLGLSIFISLGLIGYIFDDSKKIELKKLQTQIKEEKDFEIEKGFLGVRAKDYIHYSTLEKSNDINEPTIVYYINVSDLAFKIGITGQSIKERFGSDYDCITVLETYQCLSRNEAYAIEQEILRRYKYLQYKGDDLLKNGNTELFHSDIRLEVKDRGNNIT